MIDKIRIKNFKSLKEVEIKLQKVNLLIGPNNSGKTNFLKGLEFVKNCFLGNYSNSVKYKDVVYRSNNTNKEKNTISFAIIEDKTGKYYHYYYILHEETPDNINKEKPGYTFITGVSKSNNIIEKKNLTKLSILNEELSSLFFMDSTNHPFIEIDKENQIEEMQFSFNKDYKGITYFGQLFEHNRIVGPKIVKHTPFSPNILANDNFIFKEIYLYAPDVNKLSIPMPMNERDKSVNSDCSNLVSFLDNMRDEKPEIIENIETDLKKYIPEFKGIRFEKVKVENDPRTFKRIGLINSNNAIFWSDELSEGALYFLAILAIVHQPEPPKVLMLEEPERYIHPRRIQEVIDLIFKLAEDKDIQVIMTTHSPLVVDEFRDMPESVFVFEMQDGETKVKNLKSDIIDVNNKLAKEKNLPEIDYTENMGENWIMGFLGGVPNA